jgi:hypothetical protein
MVRAIGVCDRRDPAAGSSFRRRGQGGLRVGAEDTRLLEGPKQDLAAVRVLEDLPPDVVRHRQEARRCVRSVVEAVGEPVRRGIGDQLARVQLAATQSGRHPLSAGRWKEG